MPPASRIQGGGDVCPASAERRRRHRGETTKGDEGDVTPNLLLKHPDTILATYI
jgi:hypothetical protein